ncbi:hypothetical protein IJ182_02030 [bacterium]|nr:hypothetical protein [bacterium]
MIINPVNNNLGVKGAFTPNNMHKFSCNEVPAKINITYPRADEIFIVNRKIHK